MSKDELEFQAKLTGILPIDKSPGMTSHDVVALVRKALRPAKIKVGHAGTLDPDATGLLLVCIGSATRLAELLAERGKVYQAKFALGKTTSTEDSSGATISEVDASHVNQEAVEEALTSFIGEIQQIPPMVSAVHHNGKRLYQLARQGIEVEREARSITIDKIELTSFATGILAEGAMIIECSKGTYVRTLCADIGAKLGVGGYMTELRRLKIGDFSVNDAVKIENIDLDTIQRHLVPASDALPFLASRTITDGERTEILHGRSIDALQSSNSSLICLVDERGELVALAELENGRLQPKKVLVEGQQEY